MKIGNVSKPDIVVCQTLYNITHHQPLTIILFCPNIVLAEAMLIFNKKIWAYGGRRVSSESRLRGIFGVSAQVCCILWQKLESITPQGLQPKIILWALIFLKVCSSEHVHVSMAGVNEKTFHKWALKFVHLLVDLQEVSLILRQPFTVPILTFYSSSATTG